ncbi:glycine zipper 2TM domain-containing protein [Pseudorhodoferax sp.]|uniref:glycine zipper 2TM domain-containing protein n=1 Tax=Pseudorhodoferax sp. TaxID=1993553 RepID=UPI002DD6524E|nr:glycine zipper 2TM domain-containing protein [Pseudorhodoferax sp.]
MKKHLLGLALAAVVPATMAQEVAQVLSAVPVVQQLAVPQQQCRTEQQVVQPANTGAGALFGTVAGGAVGNAFGSGEGRALATLLGVVLGALWGDRIEGQPAAQPQQVRHCTLHSVVQPQVVGYDVRYQYAGRQYRVQLPYDPGPTLAVQVTPVGSTWVPTEIRQPQQTAPRIGGEDFSGG